MLAVGKGLAHNCIFLKNVFWPAAHIKPSKIVYTRSQSPTSHSISSTGTSEEAITASDEATT